MTHPRSRSRRLRSRSRETKGRLQALAIRKDRAAARRPEFLVVLAILDPLKVANNGPPGDEEAARL